MGSSMKLYSLNIYILMDFFFFASTLLSTPGMQKIQEDHLPAPLWPQLNAKQCTVAEDWK